MTTTGGALCQYDSSDVSYQSGDSVDGSGGLLHERLVAYVHALTHGSRRGVWGEHSYARSRIAGRGERAGRVRSLLAPRAHSPPPDHIDVERLDERAPDPPGSTDFGPPPVDDEGGADGDDEWEDKVAAQAPHATHARLAAVASDVLRSLTLQRLATIGGGVEARRGQARAAARRLRRALALTAGAGKPPAASWLHGVLCAQLPRATRRLYEEVVSELRGAAPRLAERLTGAWGAPPPARDAALGAGGAVGPEASPWLVWVSSGRNELDARWERRLAALLHTRVLRPAPDAGGTEPMTPAAWCAAAAASVRDQLTEALIDAGERSVVLGGVGAGAALAGVLARGSGCAGGAGGVRGCALLAPPLLTCEGAPGEALAGVRLPLLVVCGGSAAGAGLARALAGRGRRVLEVRGADAELRLPRATRLRLRLPQRALDAALAEELARWALDAADAPPAADDSHDEYAHLPSEPSHSPAPTPTPTRSIEVVEGRVVSRCAGGTPLQLTAPRREPPATPRREPPATPRREHPPLPRREPSAPLHAADIMQLPVVFADDNTATTVTTEGGSGGSGSPVTVTSGRAAPVKLTRVILASRGGGGGAPGVLLRRPLRVMGPAPAAPPAPASDR